MALVSVIMLNVCMRVVRYFSPVAEIWIILTGLFRTWGGGGGEYKVTFTENLSFEYTWSNDLHGNCLGNIMNCYFI